jgi:putative colanic acid biosynthesis UDP-glucose lipid carrier transferase
MAWQGHSDAEFGHRGVARVAEGIESTRSQTAGSPHASGTVTARTNSNPLGGAAKRGFDILIAGTLLLVGAPFLLLIWLAVRLDSAGPGLFVQQRGGLDGKAFMILKFRTMAHCDTEKVSQAQASDPRVTALGRFLRKTSIDELPQLLNVLLGDMSIVGPRPHALRHDEEFASVDPRYYRRQRARPGLTGLAQVSGSRGPTPTVEKIHERVDFDLEYVTSWTPWSDVRIIWKTAALLLCGFKGGAF